MKLLVGLPDFSSLWMLSSTGDSSEGDSYECFARAGDGNIPSRHRIGIPEASKAHQHFLMRINE